LEKPAQTGRFFYFYDLKIRYMRYWSLPLLVVLLLFSVLRWTQGAPLEQRDSLLGLLSRMPDDTVKVKKLLASSQELSWTDMSTAESMASMALALSEKLDYRWGMAHSKYGIAVLFKDSDFKITEELVLESLEHARQLNDSLLIANIYNTIGNMKDNVREQEDAVRYYTMALDIYDAMGNDSLKSKIYNNLGIISDDMGEYQVSFEYYRKAADINSRTKNYSSLAINYLNMGYSLVLSGNLDSALKYYDRSIEIATEYNYRRILPYLYNNYSDYFLRRGEYGKAVEYGAQGMASAREQKNLLQEKQALIHLKNAHYSSSDLLKAYEYAEKVNAISDSIYSYTKLKEIDLLEMRHAFEQERREKALESELLRAEIQRKELTLVLIVVAAGLVILLFVFLYIVQNNRIRRKDLEQKNTLLEKEKLTHELKFKEKELEFKSKELTTNVMYLLKKNEFISSISNKLKNSKLGDKGQNKDIVHQIIQELDRSVSEENWADFEVRFQEVHVGFYNKLSRQFPDLTPNELRLCAFLRLNMTSKEIASITFQSVDSLKVARHRLRKKLDLDRDENLVAFLTQL
jgi:tetratricopeptide (TPR) repeat protein